MSTPVLIYLGKIGGTEVYQELARQAFWAAALWLSGGLLWLRARRRVTIHGG